MKSSVLHYLEISKQNVKRKISVILTDQKIKEVANAAFDFHFKDRDSLAFQEYYCKIVSNHEVFLSTPNFFRVFKQKYSLQGIDGNYLDRLEQEKERILRLIDDDNLPKLYYEFFADVSLQYDGSFVRRTLASFFAKFVHTFSPGKYCALDNPIKDYLGLRRESFYIAFVVISQAYKEWVSENPYLMQQIRMELENNKIGKPFSNKMTDLKLLDLVFWYQANKTMIGLVPVTISKKKRVTGLNRGKIWMSKDFDEP
jgi:hypothetical protein